jgi:hypothetical protein
VSIYFLVSDDDGTVLTRAVVKIGYSGGNTPRRVYDVGTGCPFRLKLYATLPGDKEREKAIQNQFAEQRIRKEWFWWTEEMAAWVGGQEHERREPVQPYIGSSPIDENGKMRWHA